MNAGSPSAAALRELVFGAHGDHMTIEHDVEKLDSARWEGSGQTGCRPPSLYVEAFTEMVNTVHLYERHLLTEDEWDVLERFAGLSYNTRYCIVRLLLRKPGQWHPLSSLQKYKHEVGEEGLIPAITDLCRPFYTPIETDCADQHIQAAEEHEIIDLTFDSDDEQGEKKPRHEEDTQVGSSSLNRDSTVYASNNDAIATPPSNGMLSPTPGDISELHIDFFCQSETSMTMLDILWRLSGEQLRDLVKTTKSKPRKQTKSEMVFALIRHATTQAVLDYTPPSKRRRARKDDVRNPRQATLPFSAFQQSGKRGTTHTPQSQERRLRELALNKLGKCVKVNSRFHALVRRLHIISYRSTEYPEALLLPALLTSFRKRTYPEYKYSRDGAIWSTREELLQYEEALMLEMTIDQELDPTTLKRKSVEAPTLGNRKQLVALVAQGRDEGIVSINVASSSDIFLASAPTGAKQEGGREDVIQNSPEMVVEETEKMQKARKVKKIFDEMVFPRWKALVAMKIEQGAKERTPGLERFEPGFVYTRIFSKALHALATLEEYRAEAAALEALLAQRFWRRGKRARWYERRAVLQTRYLCRNDDGTKNEHVLRQAMEGVQQALRDDDTGIVFRPSLVRRLCALEKRLKVPNEDRCQAGGELRKADVVSFNAIRVSSKAASMELDGNGRPSKGPGNGGVAAYFSPIPNKIAHDNNAHDEKENKPQVKSPSSYWKSTGKSVWVGNDKEEVNVEICALQYYENLGFKGFHSETRILTTIFGLLFWDVIFADVRGAFETPYQTAPLDLAEDTFYYARKDLIEARLEEIKHGHARNFLDRHDENHREKKTWCTGVRWDICGRQDLLEILDCLGGEPLSLICRLFCEDYAARSSGVPDLIIWDAAKGLCKFVEVKGPGDTPQENQKLWFDSLLRAGAQVEICKVIDVNAPKPDGRSKANRKSRYRPKAKKSQDKLKSNGLNLESEPEGYEKNDERYDNEPPAPSHRPVIPSSPRTLLGQKRPRAASGKQETSICEPTMLPTSPLRSSSCHSDVLGSDHPPKKQKVVDLISS